MKNVLKTSLSVSVLVCSLCISTSWAIEPAWTQRSASGPEARFCRAMAFDSARGRGVLFGGWYPDVYLGDTWEWDGYNWIFRSSTGPSPRNNHAMAYDSARGVVILFGGFNGSLDGETWEWDGVNWTLRATAGPLPRHSHAMAYDSTRGVVVLFGGINPTQGSLAYTWEWDGTNWTQRSPLSSPSPRYGHAMVYDSARGVVVLFGGDSGDFANDTWEWDGNNWTERAPAASPSPRTSHAMAYDSLRGVVVLFGGCDNLFNPFRDTWEWDGVDWTERFPVTSPDRRSDHAMTYDTVRERVLLFGGYYYYNPTGTYGDTWENGVYSTATISDAWWSDEVDFDGDGCVRWAQLNWQPDVVGCQGSLMVFEKYYIRTSGTSTWNLVYTTPEHTTYDCDPSDVQSRNVIFSGACDDYEFKIEIYRSGESFPDYTRDPDNDPDLDDYAGEGQAEDPPLAFIADAWWSDELDYDADGCMRQATLNWNPDVGGCDGSLTVHERIYWKPAGQTEWNLMHTTLEHTVSGCSTADGGNLIVSFGDSCADYDFKVEVWRSGESGPDDTRGPADDPGLDDYAFETLSEDVAAIISDA